MPITHVVHKARAVRQEVAFIFSFNPTLHPGYVVQWPVGPRTPRLLKLEGLTGQEHRQPLRGERDAVLGLRQLARHAGLGDVRDDGGAEGSGDADEDERTEARGVLFRLQVETGTLQGSMV